MVGTAGFCREEDCETLTKRRRAGLEIRLKLATVLGIASHRRHEKIKPVDNHEPRILVYFQHTCASVREIFNVNEKGARWNS